jgi:hypothetical protein
VVCIKQWEDLREACEPQEREISFEAAEAASMAPPQWKAGHHEDRIDELKQNKIQKWETADYIKLSGNAQCTRNCATILEDRHKSIYNTMEE